MVYGLFSCVGLIGAALLNYLIDPEGVFLPFGEFTPAAIFNIEDASPRRAMPIIIAHQQPSVAAFGNSRVRFSWNPEHVLFRDQSAVNAAINGAKIYEMYKYVRHAHFSGPGLQTAYIGLDLSIFEPGRNSREGFEESSLRDSRVSGNTVSRPVPKITQLLNFAISSMIFSHLNRVRKGRIPRLNGFYEEMPGSNRQPKLLRFLIDEVHYRKVYARFKDRGEFGDQLRWYSDLVSFAYAHDIELITYFNPIHARLSLVMQRAGALEYLHALKAFVVTTHKEQARAAGRTAFAVWDFSNLSSITRETLPLSGASNTMQFYWDASHHNAAVGDVMIRTMASGKVQRPDFGVRLDAVELADYFAEVTDDLQVYLAAHEHYQPHLDFVMNNPRLTLEEVECHPKVSRWLKEAGHSHACR
jgi:hypothetical protein